MFSRFRVKDPTSQGDQLHYWSNSGFAGYLLNVEGDILRQKYSSLPGYRFMHVGLSDHSGPFVGFSQEHSFRLQTHYGDLGSGTSAIASLSDLPLPAGVVDISLLQHCLEFSISPQIALAEACRVTAAGGHLIICIFNPFGPSGLMRWPMQLVSDKPQYRFHALRLGRLIDWLKLLSFEIQDIDHGGFRWPTRRAVVTKLGDGTNMLDKWTFNFDAFCRQHNLPMGNFYIIHAVKRITRGITVGTRPWQRFSTSRLSGSASISTMRCKNDSSIFCQEREM